VGGSASEMKNIASLNVVAFVDYWWSFWNCSLELRETMLYPNIVPIEHCQLRGKCSGLCVL